MKKHKLVFPLLCSMAILLSGCDAPGGGRSRSRVPGSTAISNLSSTAFSPAPTGTLGDNSTNNNTGSNSNTNVQSETGYANCNLNNLQGNSFLGNLAICHSSVDETKIKVKFNSADQSDGTCFIPTHKNPDGTSIYIGVAQCTYHTNGQILNGTLVKNRQGYSTASLNGVMIMKRSYLNDYFACMDAIPNFITNNCPTNTTNTCYAQAQAFMGQVCSYFKNRGNYLDLGPVNGF